MHAFWEVNTVEALPAMVALFFEGAGSMLIVLSIDLFRFVLKSVGTEAGFGVRIAFRKSLSER